MSRMSSWNRPSKHSAIPPPYYITVGEDTPYCHTCGRVMSSTKASKKEAKADGENKTPVKYCSVRCRKRKPGPLDREIEAAFLSLLNGQVTSADDGGKSKSKAKSKKGEARVLVKVNDVEELVFGKRPESEKTRVGKRNETNLKDWRSVDMESSSESEELSDSDDGGSGGAQVVSSTDANEEMVSLKHPASRTEGDRKRKPLDNDESEKHESPAEIEKRDEGQKRAEHREMVRRAARRGVVFGFTADQNPSGQENGQDTRRKCEAVVNGSVVEPSFAKGNWGVRWRE